MTGLTVHIPTLEHEPLLLRAPTRDDVGALARMLQHQPSRYSDTELSFERAVGVINEHVCRWVTDGLGFWAIILESSAMGIVGFSGQRETPELDIAIDLNAENQGLGTQACRMVLEWLFNTQPDVKFARYCVDAGNDRATALAERLGGIRLELTGTEIEPVTTDDTWYRLDRPS